MQEPVVKSFFRIGKIFQKSLLLDILSSSLSKIHCLALLYHTSKKSRSYLVQYHKYFIKYLDTAPYEQKFINIGSCITTDWREEVALISKSSNPKIKVGIVCV